MLCLKCVVVLCRSFSIVVPLYMVWICFVCACVFCARAILWLFVLSCVCCNCLSVVLCLCCLLYMFVFMSIIYIYVFCCLCIVCMFVLCCIWVVVVAFCVLVPWVLLCCWVCSFCILNKMCLNFLLYLFMCGVYVSEIVFVCSLLFCIFVGGGALFVCVFSLCFDLFSVVW